MGNILGGQPQSLALNIPVDQNDLNRTHQQQVASYFLNWGLPILGIALMAYTQKKHKQRERELVERHIVDISALKMQLTEKGLPIFSSSEIMNTIPMVVASLEKQEDRELQAKESQLKVYERGLMDILDIRCSAFKDSNNRKRIEEDLIKRMMTPDFKLQDLQMYSGLQEVYQNDYRFCGPNAQQNGKLRQLYVKQWKLQLELKKYKNIVERLKKVQVQIEKK